jgi:adenylyltransferase/sulfurtransferase
MPCSGIIRKNEMASRAPTTPVIASVIGAVQVQETMKLLHREQMEAGELTSLCGKVFYYEGQHLTTQTADFAAYDDDCPVHDCWKPVVVSPLTTCSTVAETLDWICSRFAIHDSRCIMTNDCFVDYVEDRQSGKQIDMMCVGHCVAERIERDASLRGKSDNDYYQHEFSVLDRAFPYPTLTLNQIGIPAWDVLHVRTEQGDYYVEMQDELHIAALLYQKE